MWRKTLPVVVTAIAMFVCHCWLDVRIGGAGAEEDERDAASGPVSQRDAAFWQDRLVVQTRGWVLAQGDEDHIIRKEYWKLGPAAVGRVTSVRADGTAVVEFETGTGWEKRGFDEREVRSQRWDAEFDQYGHPIAVRMRESVREGVQVEPGDHGHLLEEDGERRTVRFPFNCLGLPPPLPGTRVVPGPDMEPHEARRLAGVVGTVMGVRDADHYICVRWDDTGREKVYRFDCRRHYDVLSVGELDDDRSSR